jgi:hypothetical protein
MFAWLLTLALADMPALENDYFKVMRNVAVCGVSATANCGDRVIVALAPLMVESDRGTKRLDRGEIAVFGPAESYQTPKGEFYEVALKTNHPPLKSPPVWIPPKKNRIVYDGKRLRVFEERLEVGDTRALHSHAQRIVIPLNATILEGWPAARPTGPPASTHVEVPDTVRFAEPAVHVIRNAGDRVGFQHHGTPAVQKHSPRGPVRVTLRV